MTSRTTPGIEPRLYWIETSVVTFDNLRLDLTLIKIYKYKHSQLSITCVL